MKNNFNKSYSRAELEKITKGCETCLQYPNSKIKIRNTRLQLDSPFSRMHIDMIGPLPKSDNGNKYIIVAVEAMTPWPEARAIKRKTAHEVAKFIIEEVFSRHDVPKQIVFDQGKEFMNSVIEDICKMIVSDKSNATLYNPQWNGTVERLNKTLMDKIMKLINRNFEQ